MKTKSLLLFLMLALGLPMAMRAQEELTVYPNASLIQDFVPVYGAYLSESEYGFFQCEFIIPASELNAMTGKMISIMSFHLSSPAAASWGNATFNVFLKETDETVFDSDTPAYYGTEGASIVYQGSLDATGSSMDVFFDNAYPYNGGNLLIGLYQTAYGTGNAASFLSVPAEDAAIIGFNGSPEYAIMPCLPKTTFTYSTSTVTCYKPRNLMATVGTTTATLNWTNGHEETSWQLVYADAPFDPTTVATSSIINVNTKPFTISGLTTETTYYVYLRANCGDSHSDWSAVCSFTPTNSLALTINEGGMYDGGFPAPIYSYYTNNGVSSQFIIPANELANVMNGQITKLTFYNMSSSISWGDAEFKVYLGEMEASEFNGTEIMPWSEMTEVYNGALSVSGGMMEINFAIPYSYSTDNLVVGFDQTVVGTQGTTNDMWYGVSSSGSNNVLYNFGYSYMSAQAVPKTTIHYTIGTPPQCVKPRNLQAEVTPQTSTLNWENGLDETSWEISYSTTEGNPETGTMVSATTKPYTITGLTTGTTYYAYIRANCGDSYSAWSTVCSFTPTDAPTTVDLTVYNGTYSGSGVPIQSQYTNFGVSSQYIIPSAYLTDVAYGQINSLLFYCNTESVSWGEASSFKVYLGETDAEHFSGSNVLPWDDLTEVYSGNLSVSESTLHIIFNTPYEYEGDNLVVGVQQTTNGTTASGVSWYGVGDWDGNTALYGVFGSYYSNYYLPKTTINYTSGTAPSCPRPKNLTASETDAHSTKLSWTVVGDENAWVLQYATDENFTQNVVSTNVTTNPYVLAGLASETTYYARIKAHCDENDESDWSNVCSFTPACPKPENLFASYIGAVSATMTWTNGGDENAWVLQYATDNVFAQNVVSIVVTTNPYIITGLTSGTTYYVRIKADCGNGDESVWSNVCSFMPSADQTTVNGGAMTNNTIPVYGSWVDMFSKSQFIIPATTMGNDITDANITNLTFYCTTTTINWGAAEFDVYMKEVANSAFSSTSLDWTELTKVYTGQLFVANNLMTIELSAPYQYGGGNLLIGIKQTNSGTYKGSSWYGVATDYNSAVGGYEASKELSFQQFLPKVTFTYLKASCSAPTNLNISDVTQIAATFGWTPGADETAWQVQFKKESDADWSATIDINATPNCTLTGLTSATPYQARVRSACGGDEYSEWKTVEFTTECGAEVPYSYNFDSDATGTTPPQCWTFIGGNYPRVYAGNAHSAPNGLCFYHQNNTVQQLVVLPEMDLTTYPMQELQIVFWVKAGSATSMRDLLVGVMTDPNDVSTFTSVERVSPGTAYNEFTVSFENYSGTGKYIAFRDFSYNTNNTSFYIDDITVEPIPSCKKPGRPYVDSYAIQAHQAYVSWSKGSEDQSLWQFALGTDEDFDPDEVTPIDVDVTNEELFYDYGTGCSYYLTGLSAATTYYIYVRANCGTTEEPDYSDWNALPRSFTTIGCDIPNQLSMLDYSATTAWLSWNTGSGLENDYTLAYSTIEYFDPDDSEQCTYVTGIAETGYTLEGLTAETIYYARVRANCGDDGYSSWSDQLEFMPSAIHTMTVYEKWKIQNRAPLPLDFVDYNPDQDQQPMIGQYVLPEIELLDMRFSKIHRLSLFTASTIDLNSNALFNVYLKEVDEPTMNGFISFEQMTQVYTGVISIFNGVMTIVFDEPFYYTEGSLMIGFKQLTPGDKIYDAGAWRGIDPHVAACYTNDYRQGTETPSFLPTTRFTYEPYNVPSCAWPIMLKALPMATFAKLSWSLGSGECDVRYKQVTDADWTLVEGVSISTYEPYILRNLSPSTNYEYQVRKVCGENEFSDWSKSRTFTTCSGNVITINPENQYVEEFDGAVFPPTDWVTESDSYVSFWHSRETTHEHYLVANSGSYNDAAMYTPELHIDAQGAVLYLSNMHNSSYNGTATYCVMMVSTDHGEHFTNLWGGMDATVVGDWIETRISLDDYVDQDIVLKFYHLTHPTVSHSWDINEIKIKAFNKVFNGDEGGGDWSDPNMWSLDNGELPTLDDEVLVNSSVTIPEGTVAQAGQIYLNDVENSTEIQGAITIEDGGQLQVNDTVTVTMQTDVNGYGRGGSNWYLIAPPVQQDLYPSNHNVTGVLTGSYDLYAFDGSYEGAEWRNYKKHQNEFVFHNGYGYLVANSANVSPSFKGTVLPSNQAKTVDLAYSSTTFGAWTLVGNPYTCDAYFQDNRSFYRMNDEGTALTSGSGVIHPMEGVFVEANNADETVTFTTSDPQQNNGNGKGALAISLSKNRGAEADRVSIRFDKGPNLSRFEIMSNPDKLFIPRNGKDYAVVHSDCIGEMPLNLKASENGTYTISVSIQEVDMQYLHLIDNLTGNDIDLLETPSYTFEARYTDYASRFKLVFAKGNADMGDNFAFINNGQIIINGEGIVQVVDVMGRVVVSRDGVHTLSTSEMTPGVYVLRLINGEKVRTQKIVVD